MPLKNVLRGIGLIVAFAAAGRADGFEIHFKASPALESIRPYSAPTTLALLVTGADGKPADGNVVVRLDAPGSGRFFSTDFPFVEGSRLLEMTVPLKRGKAEWKYLFPIRGEYLLRVEYMAADGGKFAKTFLLRVSERKLKWVFLGLFSLALFSLGVAAGRIFTSRPSDTAPGIAIGLLLSAATLGWPIAGVGGQVTQEGDRFGGLEIGPATVGMPSAVNWRLRPAPKEGAGGALLDLTITHLEKAKTVFALEKLPVMDEFRMSFQFTDGADYRVEARAFYAGQPPLRAERIVAVTGAEPVARAMMPALIFFVAMIAAGLAIGRWSKRRRPTVRPQ